MSGNWQVRVNKDTEEYVNSRYGTASTARPETECSKKRPDPRLRSKPHQQGHSHGSLDVEEVPEAVQLTGFTINLPLEHQEKLSMGRGQAGDTSL